MMDVTETGSLQMYDAKDFKKPLFRLADGGEKREKFALLTEIPAELPAAESKEV